MAEKAKQQRFSVVLERTDTSGSTTFTHVPFDVRAVYGRARLPVRVTVEGYTYRSTVAVYGGKYFLPVRREVREAAKVEASQRVQVMVEPDEAPRTVDVPPDLAAALKRVKGEVAGAELLAPEGACGGHPRSREGRDADAAGAEVGGDDLLGAAQRAAAQGLSA